MNKKQTQKTNTKNHINRPPFSELGDAKQRTNTKMEISAKN